ncbi:MAG: hypothetical protein M0030_04585 [Actinomycetota bacterium]|nr:hypothetical protein [Actinomycetota bacterium]
MADAQTCKCGCGAEVAPGKRYLKGHWAKHQAQKRGTEPTPDLPDPDDTTWDLGEIFPDDGDLEDDEPQPEGSWDGDVPPWVTDGQDPEPEPDPEPAHAREAKPSRRGKTAAARPVRVTAGVRRDVHAKIQLAVVLPGKVWEARDPMCGGTFVHQAPEIADALTDIVCDSPDLLNWFTGPAGGFMKYFKLVMALQPVGLAVWAHHGPGTRQQFPDGTMPPQPQMEYAA